MILESELTHEYRCVDQHGRPFPVMARPVRTLADAQRIRERALRLQDYFACEAAEELAFGDGSTNERRYNYQQDWAGRVWHIEHRQVTAWSEVAE